MAAQIFNRLGQIGMVSDIDALNELHICTYNLSLTFHLMTIATRVLRLEELWSTPPSSMWTEVTGRSSSIGYLHTSTDFTKFK